MKTRQTSSISIIVLFIAFMICSFSGLYGQNKEDQKLAGFLIVVESNKDEVKLIGKYGCAWKELTFKFSGKEDSKTVDQFGMTTLTEAIAKKDPKPSFIFTIQRTDKGFGFVCIQGALWRELSFGFPKEGCHQPISENGMEEYDTRQ
ncbi:MAG: hypothetical protein WC833_06435 [Bacteroidales bacterium]|jgi:hypothetical protein